MTADTVAALLAQVLHDSMSHYQGHVNPQTETHRVQHEYDARVRARRRYTRGGTAP